MAYFFWATPYNFHPRTWHRCTAQVGKMSSAPRCRLCRLGGTILALPPSLSVTHESMDRSSVSAVTIFAVSTGFLIVSTASETVTWARCSNDDVTLCTENRLAFLFRIS